MAGMNAALLIVLFINFAVYAAILVGIIALEVWLSRRKSRWPGLIMPIITFAASLLLVLGTVAFTRVGGATSELQVEDAETCAVIYQEQRAEQAPDWTLGDTAQVGLLLLVGNIPTFVLLGAYYIGREKLRREKLLEKMNIQDL